MLRCFLCLFCFFPTLRVLCFPPFFLAFSSRYKLITYVSPPLSSPDDFNSEQVIRSSEAARALTPAPRLALSNSQQQQQQHHQQQPILSHAAVHAPPGPVGGGRGQQPQARGPATIGMGGRSSSSPSYVGGPDILPVGGGGGGGPPIGVSGACASGDALDGSGTGSSSSSLPFFQQFREANGGGGGGTGLALSAGVSAAPGAGRPSRHSHDGVQQQKGAGEVVGVAEGGGGGSGGASALQGILGGGMGSLGGVDGESDNNGSM